MRVGVWSLLLGCLISSFIAVALTERLCAKKVREAQAYSEHLARELRLCEEGKR
jgi:hypothetical protein